MLLGAVLWVARYWGVTGSSDVMGGLILGIVCTAYVAWWRKQ